jgi:hypothetical protein
MPLPDLIGVDDYLTATGQNADDLDLGQVSWAISAASQTVRDYTDRDFVLVADADQAPRTFTYEGGSELETDDCTAVSQVQIAPTTFDSGRVMDPTEYFPMKNKNGTIDTIELFTLFGRNRGSYSPEMGFTRNLDTLPIIAFPIQLVVTATWGWPEIPLNVKQAMVWGTADFLSDAGPYNSESIANYSRMVSSSRAAVQIVNPFPERVLALLTPYVRWPI